MEDKKMRNKTWRERIGSVVMVIGMLAALGMAASSTASAQGRSFSGRESSQVACDRDGRDRYRGYEIRDRRDRDDRWVDRDNVHYTSRRWTDLERLRHSDRDDRR
jgi:hypothetical protein